MANNADINIISGFNPSGYKMYGQAFLESFNQFWPDNYHLAIYTEQPLELERGECRSLWDIEGVREFIDYHGKIPKHCGKSPMPCWKPKEVRNKYSFRTDAVKFCRQLLIPDHAIRNQLDGEIMVWLDGDVITYETVPKTLISELLRNSDLCYLGREGFHSEIGFWAIRVNARTRKFCWDMAEMCRSGEIFTLPQWHSAYVFDHVKERHQIIKRNLTEGYRGHVWGKCHIGRYTNHLKGTERKKEFLASRARNAA